MTAPNWDSALTGIANAIDLADKFLPKLQSSNCEYFPLSDCFFLISFLPSLTTSS